MSVLSEEKGELMIKESYLRMIENSVGCNMFRNFYSLIDDTETDIMRDGDLSCAYFVSSVLVVFQLIKETHSEVVATVKDMTSSGWKEIKKPCLGSVIVWGNKKGLSGEIHKHIGFYVGGGVVISNNDINKSPSRHHWTYDDKREVEAIFWKEM